MRILLTAATSAEIQPAIDHYQAQTGSINPKPAILISGVGMVATTYSLCQAISRQKPDIIIQAGIAGSFMTGHIGDVLIVERDAIADLGVWENSSFQSIHDLKLADGDAHPFSAGVLKNPWKNLMSMRTLKTVNAITINEISTRPESLRWYQQKFMPVVESMEGAAFHYVCLQEGIPFLQLRSISNRVGERDKKQWNIPLAIRNLNNELISLLSELNSKDETYIRI